MTVKKRTRFLGEGNDFYKISRTSRKKRIHVKLFSGFQELIYSSIEVSFSVLRFKLFLKKGNVVEEIIAKILTYFDAE